MQETRPVGRHAHADQSHVYQQRFHFRPLEIQCRYNRVGHGTRRHACTHVRPAVGRRGEPTPSTRTPESLPRPTRHGRPAHPVRRADKTLTPDKPSPGPSVVAGRRRERRDGRDARDGPEIIVVVAHDTGGRVDDGGRRQQGRRRAERAVPRVVRRVRAKAQGKAHKRLERPTAHGFEMEGHELGFVRETVHVIIQLPRAGLEELGILVTPKQGPASVQRRELDAFHQRRASFPKLFVEFPERRERAPNVPTRPPDGVGPGRIERETHDDFVLGFLATESIRFDRDVARVVALDVVGCHGPDRDENGDWEGGRREGEKRGCTHAGSTTIACVPKFYICQKLQQFVQSYGRDKQSGTLTWIGWYTLLEWMRQKTRGQRLDT